MNNEYQVHDNQIYECLVNLSNEVQQCIGANRIALALNFKISTVNGSLDRLIERDLVETVICEYGYPVYYPA